MALKFQPFQNLYIHIKSSDPRLGEALDRISAYLQELIEAANSIESSITPNNNPSIITNEVPTNVIVMEVAIAGADANVNVPRASVDGDILIVYVTNDAVGYTVIWGAGFIYPPIVPNAPNTFDIIEFYGRSSTGSWYYSGSSILGRHV